MRPNRLFIADEAIIVYRAGQITNGKVERGHRQAYRDTEAALSSGVPNHSELEPAHGMAQTDRNPPEIRPWCPDEVASIIVRRQASNR